MNIHLAVKIFILSLAAFFISQGNMITASAAEPGGSPTTEIKNFQQMPSPVKEEKSVIPFLDSAPDRNAIGCVLPLSGKYEDYGSKALDAVLLAAGVFDGKNKTARKILVEDSRGVPEGIKSAIDYLAKTKNVMAIIAVAGTSEAIVVASEADKWKIPIILISSKEGVTDASNYLFQHFLTPSQQIEALVNYALNHLNCAIFSILYPQDEYGMEMVKIFSMEAARIGGKIERAIPYGKTQTDFTEVIKKITGDGISPAQKVNVRREETKTPVSIDFEALFIPDSYSRVRMITSQLAFHDITGARLLGTSLWNSPGLLKDGAGYLEGAVFADSFFVNSFYPEVNDFVDIYYTAYSREPENIEALAYDTTGMIISILENGNIQTREQFIDGLQQLKNYRGVTGITSFSSGRVARKNAFMLQVRNGKLVQVK
jgi:branched-chain amino acid transport system substrate-binding protein